MKKQIILSERKDLVKELACIISLVKDRVADDVAIQVLKSTFYHETRTAEELNVSHMGALATLTLLNIAKSSETITKLDLRYTELESTAIQISEIVAEFPQLKVVDLSHTYPGNLLEMVKILLTSKSISYINFGNVKPYGNISPCDQQSICFIFNSHNIDLVASQEKQKNNVYQFLKQEDALPLPDVCVILIGEYYVDPIVEVAADFCF